MTPSHTHHCRGARLLQAVSTQAEQSFNPSSPLGCWRRLAAYARGKRNRCVVMHPSSGYNVTAFPSSHLRGIPYQARCKSINIVDRQSILMASHRWNTATAAAVSATTAAATGTAQDGGPSAASAGLLGVARSLRTRATSSPCHVCSRLIGISTKLRRGKAANSSQP